MAAWFVAVLPSAPAAAASAAKPASATTSFARGVVALAKHERSHDPLVFSRLTGIALRHPNKWTDQPDGTRRAARWRNPPNRVGVLDVVFDDTPVGDGEIAFSADLDLQGAPCVTISQLERAAGRKAAYGGTVIPFAFHGPLPPPYELGLEHAALEVVGRSGRPTSIRMVGSQPGPHGCLKRLGLHSTRLSPHRTK